MAAFAKLTDAERERLEMLAEEAGEVVQAVMKILRHGYENYHPDRDPRTTNAVYLVREITDFAAVVYMMGDAGDIKPPEPGDIEETASRKLRFTYHQPYNKQCASCRHEGTDPYKVPCRDCVGFDAFSKWERRI